MDRLVVSRRGMGASVTDAQGPLQEMDTRQPAPFPTRSHIDAFGKSCGQAGRLPSGQELKGIRLPCALATRTVQTAGLALVALSPQVRHGLAEA
jgi:hypothetical protein